MAVRRDDGVWDALPDELWEHIFAYLDGEHYGRRLEPVSLVCKRFLALSNRARTTFFLPVYHHPFPLAIFSRFRHVRTVRLLCCGDAGDSVAHLARSALPIRAFHLSGYMPFPRDHVRLLGRRMGATLKSLSFTDCLAMNDDDVAAVADSFPDLQQLDLSDSPVTDQGILSVALKLKSLVSVNLCSQRWLTPRSLHYLSSNCPSISQLSAAFSEPVSLLDHILPFSSLTSLHLARAEISEIVLRRLSTANLKLWKLLLVGTRRSNDLSGATLCRFLKSCRHLRHLQLYNFEFPTDLSVPDFAASIPNIQLISLGYGNKLPEGTFFHLLSACTCLQEIAMSCAHLGTLSGLPVLYRVRKLILSECRDLSDEALAVMGSIFPNIESLRFSACSRITNLGIEAIKTRCSIIKHFNVGMCHSLDNFSLTNQIEEPWLLADYN